MSLTVSIVGRPNVGKSTLFNRLIGRRKAIVHDEYGVTRDRHYGDSFWNGKQFSVIDTGGYLPDETDSISEGIREQIHLGPLPPPAPSFVSAMSRPPDPLPPPPGAPGVVAGFPVDYLPAPCSP